mgnify:CR=1 FL=1
MDVSNKTHRARKLRSQHFFLSTETLWKRISQNIGIELLHNSLRSMRISQKNRHWEIMWASWHWCKKQSNEKKEENHKQWTEKEAEDNFYYLNRFKPYIWIDCIWVPVIRLGYHLNPEACQNPYKVYRNTKFFLFNEEVNEIPLAWE